MILKAYEWYLLILGVVYPKPVLGLYHFKSIILISFNVYDIDTWYDSF